MNSISFKAMLLKQLLIILKENASILNHVALYFGIDINLPNAFVLAHQRAVCGGLDASGQDTTGLFAEFESDISLTLLSDTQKDYARAYYLVYIKDMLIDASARQSTATAYNLQNPSNPIVLTNTSSDLEFVHRLAFFVAINQAENIV